mmetsp:Transcript_11309/g.34010  ORF Transcript_11309/g.34010 Transcript_11309/m.34010 type:complete len:418 (-) Transcript_11309:1132-2385(-)
MEGACCQQQIFRPHCVLNSAAQLPIPNVSALRRLRVRPGQHATQRCGTCCSMVRKDGSAETRGVRPVDTSQPTLREQFDIQQQEQQSAPTEPVVATAEDPAVPLHGRDGSRDGGGGSPIRTTGLRRSPLTGAVNNASQQFDLPSPTVAVRNLVEQAQFAHLCTVMSSMHHRRSGYPFGTLVDFASDGDGYPIFCMSPLAIHTRNIVEDPRCSLVVQMPGWTGLANARVTIFGDVFLLPAEFQEPARQMFAQKHAKEGNEQWLSGNALFFRMDRISDIYFVGGFGTVQWVDEKEYTRCKPDAIVMHQPHRVLRVLNDTFSATIPQLLKHGEQTASSAEFISIDRLGADVRARFGSDYSVERVGFEQPVHTLEEAVACVGRMLPALDQQSSQGQASVQAASSQPPASKEKPPNSKQKKG